MFKHAVAAVLVLSMVVVTIGCRRGGAPERGNPTPGPGPATGGLDAADTSVADALSLDLVGDRAQSTIGWCLPEGGKIVEVNIVRDAKKPPRSFTDGDIATLARCFNLRKLSITLSPTVANFTGVGLRQLAGLKDLTYLNLYVSPLREEGLREIAALTQLRYLRFYKVPQSNIREASLSFLASLTKLEELDIDGCVFGPEAGIRIADALPRLKRLNISSNQIGDQGLSAIVAKMPELTALSLMQTSVTDQGLALLPRLTKLEDLGVSHDVTDLGMKSIAGCANLRSLRIFATRATDNALEEIGKLPRLEKLEITNGTTGKISPQAIAKFSTAHPKCKVTRGAGE